MKEINIKNDVYPESFRNPVRVLAKHLDHQYAFLRIKAIDISGYRDQLETAGGGIEPGETPAPSCHP